jgi:hypothetical protein
MKDDYVNMQQKYVNMHNNYVEMQEKCNPMRMWKHLINVDILFMVTYGGIFLSPTCKLNYVKMQENYVSMQENYVNMQENYVNMQVTNLLGEYDFDMGKITCLSPYLTL